MYRGAAALAASVVGLALLVSTGAQRQAPPKPKPADNSYCEVCHANLKSEPLARAHQRAGVGCARCHGESDRHSSDENNVTPPDIMYPADGIAPACMKCHPAAALGKPRLRPIHKRYLATRPSAAPCTSCHGSHRLPVRTRRWDKVTRKLISDDGVRLLPDANAPRK